VKGITEVIGDDPLTLSNMIRWLTRINQTWPNRNTNRTKRGTLKDIISFEFPETSQYEKRHLWIDATFSVPPTRGLAHKTRHLSETEFDKVTEERAIKRYVPFFKMMRTRDLRVTAAINLLEPRTKSGRLVSRCYLTGQLAKAGRRALGFPVSCEMIRRPA
jgi:hypothetical protein